MNRTYSVVAYLARTHGLNGLRALIQSERYQVVQVFTHQKVPSSQNPDRPQREEYSEYVEVCQRHGIPLASIDRKRDLDEVDRKLDSSAFDLNVSISWRFLIPPRHLQLASIGGVNLHRGKLPEYSGGEPIVRMLEDGWDDAFITAHELAPELDSGPVIQVVREPMTGNSNDDLLNRVEQVKQQITPLFGPLLIGSLDKLVSSRE